MINVKKGARRRLMEHDEATGPIHQKIQKNRLADAENGNEAQQHGAVGLE